MSPEHTQSRLSKGDIQLIVAVLDYAYRNDLPVAQVVQHRLAQNWTALDMCLEDGDAETARVIGDETKRLRLLQRRFASWRPAKSRRSSPNERPKASHPNHAAKA